MRWMQGTLVPARAGRRLAKGEQGRLRLQRVRRDGDPRPPGRRNGQRHKVAPAKQYQTFKPGPIVGRFSALLSTLESPTPLTKSQPGASRDPEKGPETLGGG